MKLYCLTNNYCLGTQAGIQSLHATVNLMKKYYDDSPYGTACVNTIHDWTENHETVVMVKGGDHESLQHTMSLLELYAPEHNVPFAGFQEEGLNNAWTSVAVLCSTDMVDDMDAYRRRFITDDEMYEKYNDFASVLIPMAMARTTS